MNSRLKNINQVIYLIRNQKVMLDSDLAELYGVETRILNRNVKRNLERFPSDFMFQLDPVEFEALVSQIGISKQGRGGRQSPPYVFTESGIAMLSSVLRSQQAIEINITIMRLFIRLRNFHALEERFEKRLNTIESDTKEVFKIIFEKLDTLEVDLPTLPSKRKRIGLDKN